MNSDRDKVIRSAEDVQRLVERIGLPWDPLGTNVFVLPLVQAGYSLIVSKEVNRQTPEPGLVIRCGKGGTSPETGTWIDVRARPGQLVLFDALAGQYIDVPTSEPSADTVTTLMPLYTMHDADFRAVQQPGHFALLMHEDDPRKIHELGRVCEFCEVEERSGFDRRRNDERRLIDGRPANRDREHADEPDTPPKMSDEEIEARKRWAEEQRQRLRELTQKES
jgi:hypothetical protein